jgi:hypothetical protein
LRIKNSLSVRNTELFNVIPGSIYDYASSSSSSGPGAYASYAPQPIRFVCDPILDVPISAARRLHVHTTRKILATKGASVGENFGR